MFALPLGYCENAPLDIMTPFYSLVVIGLVYKALVIMTLEQCIW